MTAPEEAPDPLLGRIIDRRYRVDARVGRGAHGVVYRGWHLTLDAPIALKVLLATTPRRAERFAHEARVLLSLKHPHVVSALDMGFIERDGERRPYIVMDWCEGETLEAHLARCGPLSVRAAFEIVEPLADALTHLHALGVVHRDVKPSNVMVAKDTRGVVARLVDFGVAKTSASADEPPEDGLAFTPAYAAPEQVVGDVTGPSTDVHALGLVMIEMVTGKKPYGVDAPLERAVLPERPSARALGVDVGAFEPVLSRAVAQRPADRFADGAALRDALREAARDELGEDVPPSSLRAELPSPRMVERGPRVWPRALVVIALALVLTAALAVFVLAPRRARNATAGTFARATLASSALASAGFARPRSACALTVDELASRGFEVLTSPGDGDRVRNLVVRDERGVALALALLSDPGDAADASSRGRVALAKSEASIADIPQLSLRSARSSDCLMLVKGPPGRVDALVEALRGDAPASDALPRTTPATEPTPNTLASLSTREFCKRLEAAGGQLYDADVNTSENGTTVELSFERLGVLATAWLERGPYARPIVMKFLNQTRRPFFYALDGQDAVMLLGVDDDAFAAKLVEGLSSPMTKVTE
ncbi:MAG: serine/threonine-protein kinase [Polyangiaceae bacterium]